MDLFASGRAEFELQNVEQMHRKYPDTFNIAPRRVRTQMRPYDRVKVILVASPPPVSGPKTEDLWVVITEISADRYVGRLERASMLMRVKLGEAIELGPEHIADFDLRMALGEPVPSQLHPGYVHVAGRHVSVLGGSGTALTVQVLVPPTAERTSWWKEKLVLSDQLLRAIKRPDPLTGVRSN